MKTKLHHSSKLSVSLPSDLRIWLQNAAAKRRTSVSYLIREALLPVFQAGQTNSRKA